MYRGAFRFQLPTQRFFRNGWSLSILILVLSLVVSGIIIALPHPRSAHASGATLSVTPAKGAYTANDDQIPITVQGLMFAPNEVVKVYWNYTGPNTGSLEATATANKNGNFSVDFLRVLAAHGTYTIASVGQTSGSVATATFTQLPQVYLRPQAGGPGSPTTVYGDAFDAGETVKIFWNSKGHTNSVLIATATGNSTGSFTVNATIPTGYAPGVYYLAGVGQTSKTIATYKYTIYTPTLALAPVRGSANTALTVSTYGFIGLETVDIFWNNDSTPLASVATNGFGCLIPTMITVPAAAPGRYPVKVVGRTSQLLIANTYTVLAPSSNLSASSGPVGLNVAIAGQGYAANETVHIIWKYTGPNTGNNVADLTAGYSGTIQGNFIVPTAANGAYTTSGYTISAPVTINTNWGDFGFNPAHQRVNPYENGLGVSNVGNLQPKWTQSTAVGFKSSPVYANGIVYIATMDGLLNAYDATSGTLKWSFNPNSTFRNYSAPAVDPATGLVFFGTVGNNDEGIPSPYYAVDAQTGTLQWSVILNWHQVSFPTLAFNTLYLGTSHLDHDSCSIYAIDEVSGQIRWQYTANAGFWGAIGVDLNTNTVFSGVGNPEAAVIALNATTGTLVWNYSVPQFGPDDDVGSGITVTNGLVYASSKNGSVYAIHEVTGTLSWTTPIGKDSNGDISTQAVSDNGTLYAGSISGNLYALNAQTGAILWKTHAGASIFSSPAVANGVIYFSSYNKIYALNTSTGTILWSYATGANSYSSPIVVNGWLYWGSGDGTFYGFSL